MQEKRLKEIWDNILKDQYSLTEWRKHETKENVLQLWGKHKNTGEWVRTAYVKVDHG